MSPVIAVDGPTGSGKGTLAYRVSEALGFHLLDSGALYRLTALAARRKGVALDDPAGLARVASELDVSFRAGVGDPPVVAYLEDENVDHVLRSEGAGEDASRVAAVPAVREALLDRQREFRRAPGLVADGRDMGTAVFVDAVLKIFVTASPKARARRRYKQLIGKGIDVSLQHLLEDIEVRDRRDSGRSASPLKPADDAVVIDSTELTLDAVFEHVMTIAAERGLVVVDRQ